MNLLYFFEGNLPERISIRICICCKNIQFIFIDGIYKFKEITALRKGIYLINKDSNSEKKFIFCIIVLFPK
jgi:hypothetical protein